MNLGWIILGQSCQNTGNAQWKEHRCRLTFLDPGICIYEEAKDPIYTLSWGKRTQFSWAQAVSQAFSLAFRICILSLLRQSQENGCISPICQNKKLWALAKNRNLCKWQQTIRIHDCRDSRHVPTPAASGQDFRGKMHVRVLLLHPSHGAHAVLPRRCVPSFPRAAVHVFGPAYHPRGREPNSPNQCQNP